MKVRIKRVDKSLPLPEYHTHGAAGFDIYSRENVEVAPGEYKVVPSNLVVETPEGHMLLMMARSSLFRKKGLMLANNIALFDYDFRGDDDEMLIQLFNPSKETAVIERGERIVQGVFAKFDRADWEEVDKMNNTNRGGIGSTG